MYSGMKNIQKDYYGNPLQEGDMVVEAFRVLRVKSTDNSMILLRDYDGNLVKQESDKLIKISSKQLIIDRDRNNKDIHIGDIVRIAPRKEVFKVNDFKRYSNGVWIYLCNIDGSFKSGSYRGEHLEVVKEADAVIEDIKESFIKFAEAKLKIEIDVPVEKEKSKMDEMKEIIDKMQKLK